MNEVERLRAIKFMLMGMYIELMNIENLKDCAANMDRLDSDLASAIVCVDEMIIKRIKAQNTQPAS